jgi:geranylgeranyl diphosphate/geranylgeranyl-bacteriochlorophyllide a reductase
MRIAIIGAGPAGAMAAARLARAGAAVTMFDPSHPREKPCGGGLTGRALALVSNLIDIAALPAVVVKAASVEPPSGTQQTAQVDLIDCGPSACSSLVVVSRAIFDRALTAAAIAAGARLIPEKVIDVFRHGTTMTVHTTKATYNADHVLGADGASSVTRKKLATRFSRMQLSVAAGVFVHGVSSSVIAIKSMTRQPGYLWSFPRPDHLAVGVCAPASDGALSADLRAQTLAWLESHGLCEGATFNPMRGSRAWGPRLETYAWPIPSVGFDVDHISSGGPTWMLLGDAAGLVDPLTREGIYYALLSGQWAAETLAATSPARASALYEERLKDEVQPELARAARLTAMFFTPMFSSLLVEALRQSAAIRQVFRDLVAGTQPYNGLRRRLVAAGEWKLAGRAARMAFQPTGRGGIGATIAQHS